MVADSGIFEAYGRREYRTKRILSTDRMMANLSKGYVHFFSMALAWKNALLYQLHDVQVDMRYLIE
jgi:hypothetical protein